MAGATPRGLRGPGPCAGQRHDEASGEMPKGGCGWARCLSDAGFADSPAHVVERRPPQANKECEVSDGIGAASRICRGCGQARRIDGGAVFPRRRVWRRCAQRPMTRRPRHRLALHALMPPPPEHARPVQVA